MLMILCLQAELSSHLFHPFVVSVSRSFLPDGHSSYLAGLHSSYWLLTVHPAMKLTLLSLKQIFACFLLLQHLIRVYTVCHSASSLDISTGS